MFGARVPPATLLELRDLKKHFTVSTNILGKVRLSLRALDGVSLKLAKGQSLGLLGESGCGKSTLGRTLLKLYEPTSGSILFQGEDITHFSARQMRAKRREMQIIFQDPYASLNPRMKIKDLVAEPFVIHKQGTADFIADKVRELLVKVGLKAEHMERYPHEFSGGQRQRIGIARALALGPKLIVADEPVSALDVSVQSQILNLLLDLRKSDGLSYLFISHDVAVVQYISDVIAVMYLGKIVEYTDSKRLCASPKHPYTKALIASVLEPVFHEKKLKKQGNLIGGDVPNPMYPPSGCAFHPRCPLADELCRTKTPQLRECGTTMNPHQVACHYA